LIFFGRIFCFFLSLSRKKKVWRESGRGCCGGAPGGAFLYNSPPGFASFIYSKKTTERTARNTRRAENSRRRRIEEEVEVEEEVEEVEEEVEEVEEEK